MCVSKSVSARTRQHPVRCSKHVRAADTFASIRVLCVYLCARRRKARQMDQCCPSSRVPQHHSPPNVTTPLLLSTSDNRRDLDRSADHAASHPAPTHSGDSTHRHAADDAHATTMFPCWRGTQVWCSSNTPHNTVRHCTGNASCSSEPGAACDYTTHMYSEWEKEEFE